MLKLVAMPFRVLIAGPTSFYDYAGLRDYLDAVLAKRLPDVELLTIGGPGLPALAASYARSRFLKLVTHPLDYLRHPGDPRKSRNTAIINQADAAVIVWDGRSEVWELMEAIKRGRYLCTFLANPIPGRNGR